MLSETRKADRARMAKLLIEEMSKAGATAKIEPDLVPRAMYLTVTAPGGATVSIDFDGTSAQPDVHIITWNVKGHRFFDPDVLGVSDVNPHHYSKASRVCFGFDQLLEALKRDVARFADGSGYLKLDDPRVVAMGERYKAKGWSWPLSPRYEEG